MAGSADATEGVRAIAAVAAIAMVVFLSMSVHRSASFVATLTSLDTTGVRTLSVGISFW
jgi:hypothetical protein